MAITSVGYDGSVDETQFEKIMGYTASSQYGVNEPGAFAASTVAGQVLQVRISAGTAWTAGVVDVMDAADTVQLEPVLSGSRWDLIVLRRNYQPPGGTTSLAVVKGGSSMTLPNRESVSGVLSDQPLWLVRVDKDKSTPQQFVDLRVWARNSGCTANHDLVRSYLNSTGTSIEINGTLWLLRVGANGQNEWVKPIELALEAGSTDGSTPNTVVRRNSSGNAAFRNVWLHGKQDNAADAATRKDYVDEMVDNLLDVMPNTISGNVTITPKPDTPTSVTVKFPVPSGWFKRTPNVVATADTVAIGDTVKGVAVDEVTRTGFRLWVHRTNNTQTKVYWVAT